MPNKTIFALGANIALDKANDIVHLWQPGASGEKDRKATIQTIIDLLDVNTSFANVPYLNKANTFTAENIFTSIVNIGNDPSPLFPLEVFSATLDITARIQTAKINGSAELRLQNDAQSWALQTRATNFFAITDITTSNIPFSIAAGAPTSSFTMDATGHAGLGRAPTTDFDFYRASENLTMLLETGVVNGISGIAFANDAQRWDIQVRDTDVFRISDITNGTSPITIDPTAPSNILYLDSDGGVLVHNDTSLHPTLDTIESFGEWALIGRSANGAGVDKETRMGLTHRDITEEPFLLIHALAATTANVLNIGGGDSDGNAATDIRFYTAANNITPTGTEAGRFKNLHFMIGTTTDLTSAILQIGGTVGALLLSRLTTTERNALTAVNGMVIYNTTTNVLEAYENGSWVDL